MHQRVVAAIFMVPIGFAALVLGIHDLFLGTSWPARGLGAVTIAVGVVALTPVVWVRRGRRSLRSLSTLAAAVTVAGAGVALAITEGSSDSLYGWRLGVTSFMLIAAVTLPVLLRRQEGRSIRALAKHTLREPVGKIVAANAALLSLIQIAVSLANATHTAPPRPLLNVGITSRGAVIRVSVHGANRSGSDLPVLGDIFDVIALRCPPGGTGLRLASQERRERGLTLTTDVSELLGAAEIAGCSSARLVDTGEIAGEGGFVPTEWTGGKTWTVQLPKGFNVMCVYASLWTIDTNPRQLQVLVRSKKRSGSLRSTYRIEPTGWIDEMVSQERRAVVDWTPDAATKSRSYAVPSEAVYYVVEGEDRYSNTFVGPGPLGSLAFDCSAHI